MRWPAWSMPRLESPSRPEPPGSLEQPADERYRAGDVIDGKYRLVKPLGEGGMGVVWVATNMVLDLDVAIKLIALRRGSHQSSLAVRLLQEARAAAQVVHPAICRTFDFGETELGDPFVVSELLSGETLASLLRREPRLSAVQAVQTLLPIADGLAVAHARGIVHCDVKPENLFLSYDGVGRAQPKLLDFGIARFVRGEGLPIADTGLLGTPSYMSPEQVRQEAADYRADVWSLCVVLYEAITGRSPFAGDNHSEILGRVLTLSPPPTTVAAAGDDALWRILEQGLRKVPAERWSSMRELRDALAVWLCKHGVQEDLSGTSLRPNWVEPGVDWVRIGEMGGSAGWEDETEPGGAGRAQPLSGVPTSLRYLESWSDSVEWHRSRSLEPSKLDVPTVPAPPGRGLRRGWLLVGILIALTLVAGLGILLLRQAPRDPAGETAVPR